MAELSAEALRREFDGSFALPARERAEGLVELLAIRVSGRPYALRVGEIRGIAAGRRITSVPSPESAFAGLVGIRGSMFAVYGLGELLGLPRSGLLRWVALAKGDGEIGLAFEELEDHLSMPPSALGANEGAGLCEHVLRTDAGLRPVVSVPRVVSTLMERAARARSGKVKEQDG